MMLGLNDRELDMKRLSPVRAAAQPTAPRYCGKAPGAARASVVKPVRLARRGNDIPRNVNERRHQQLLGEARNAKARHHRLADARRPAPAPSRSSDPAAVRCAMPADSAARNTAMQAASVAASACRRSRARATTAKAGTQQRNRSQRATSAEHYHGGVTGDVASHARLRACAPAGAAAPARTCAGWRTAAPSLRSPRCDRRTALAAPRRMRRSAVGP